MPKNNAALKDGILKDKAFKNAYNDSDKTQAVIKEEVNELLYKCGVNHQIGATRLNGIINGKIKNLRLDEGLALATVLKCFLSDFVIDEVLALGGFEVKLIAFESGIEFDEALLKQEFDERERICVYSTFPSYPFYQFGNPNGTAQEQQLFEINEQRFQHILNGNIRTSEYFTLDSYLNFLFSPISRMSKESKINALDRMLKVFSKIKLPNKLYFFSSSKPYQRTFSSMELFKNNALFYMNIPLPTHILAIKNKIVCDTLRIYLQQCPDLEVTNTNDSLDLLERGKELLHESKSSFVESEFLQQFYNDSSESLQRSLQNVAPVFKATTLNIKNGKSI